MQPFSTFYSTEFGLIHTYSLIPIDIIKKCRYSLEEICKTITISSILHKHASIILK